MSKGLEALEELQSEWEFDNNLPKGFVDTRVSIIEKELKALEIIKEKELNIFFVKRYKLEGFNYRCRYEQQLTREEYELLKEVLQ